MNAIITQYKKVVLMVFVAIAMSINAVDPGKCKPCAAAAAARLSAAAAHAALIVANKIVPREIELDVVPSKDSSRAPREELVDPCNTCGTVIEESCDLNCKLQTIFNCCVNTNQQVRCQGHEFEKCCKKLNRKLNDLEVFVESQSDAAAFSVIEGLIGSQIDQSAACCSVIDSVIGNVDNSAFDIPETDDIQTFVNTTDVDIITWLKSLYALVYTLAECACD